VNETILAKLLVVFEEELWWLGRVGGFGCGGCRIVDVEHFLLILLTAQSPKFSKLACPDFRACRLTWVGLFGRVPKLFVIMGSPAVLVLPTLDLKINHLHG